MAISRTRQLVYASSSIGGNAIGRSKDLWLLYFYAPPDDADIGRRAATLAVGFAIFAVRFLEAFDDPLIGYLSDHTRSRWGRRIPFVVLSTPFYAITFVLIWLPPFAGEHNGNALYLFGMLALFHLFSTLSGGPFESLLPEVARSRDERMGIVTWQVAFGVAGAAMALVISGFIVDWSSFAAMGLVMGAFGLTFRFVGLAGVWRPAVEASRDGAPPPAESFWRAIRTCMANDQFVRFLPTYIFYNLGVLMITGAIPFLVDEVLQREDEGTVTAVINGTAIAVVVLLLPVIVRLVRRHSKRRVYSWGMLFGAVYFPLMFFVGFVPGTPGLAEAVVFAAFLGIALAPSQTLPNALIADITDYDTRRTGLRHEGLYYSSQAFFEKTAGALAPLLLAGLLVLGSSSDDPLGIRLVGPVAGLSTLIGFLAFRGYRLGDEVAEAPQRPAAARVPPGDSAPARLV